MLVSERQGGGLGKGSLLDCYHYRRPDPGGGCSRLRVQRWRRRAFYLNHRFDDCRSYLAAGVDLSRSFVAIKLMIGPQLSNHKDNSTSEDRFARKDVSRYSGWSSATAITITIIVTGIVLYYLGLHSK
jgi:hypothetical protein